MALTPEQEYALLALLDEPLVTLNELPKATGVNKDDLFLTRQDTEEKAVTGEVLKEYIAAPATLDRRGTVQLSNETDSEREDRAATPKAIKKVMDFAKTRLPLSGGKLSGGLTVPYLRIQKSDVVRNIKFFNAEQQYDAGIEANDEGDIYLYTKAKTGINPGRARLKADGYFEIKGDTNIHPIGVPIPWPTQTPPPGWFKCNGAAFDKQKYPVLAKAYPSGVLPDLRGEFIRGWDDGRGVDGNRNILSSQEDTLQNITGSITAISETFANSSNTASGALYKHSNTPYGVSTPSNVDSSLAGTLAFDASRVVRTSTETRPCNIAFLYIVRAA